MSKTVKFKRGNANVSATYVGAQGEITVNTDNYTLNVHNGVTPGGFRILNSTIGNIGNLVVTDQTISGTRSGTNITISPTAGNVVLTSNLFTPNIALNRYTISSTEMDTYLTLPDQSDATDVELVNNFSNIKLSVFDKSTNVPYTLKLDTDSYLTVPGYIKSNLGGAEIQFAGEQGILLYANFATGHTGISLDDNLTEIFSNSNVVITTDYSNAGRQWYFGTDGSMYAPNDISIGGNISGNVNGYAIGYRDLPQVPLSSNVVLSLSDGGKHYYSANSTSVITIPNNATVSFTIGSTITIVQEGTANLSVEPGVGVTLYLAGNSTSSSRTLGNYGLATLLKVATDTWFINGTGVN